MASSSNNNYYDANLFSASYHIAIIDIAHSEVVIFREAKEGIRRQLTKAIRKLETNIVKDRFVK
jgi:hypothetical protein